MNLFGITGVRAFIGAAAILLAVSGMAMGEVLFTDSYDTSAPSSDVNYEIDSRTGGTYGGGSIDYNAYISNGATQTVGLVDGTKKVLQLDTLYTRDPSAARNYFWLDENFNGSDSAGGLDVDMTVKLTAEAGSTKYFIVAFGNDSSAASDETNRPLSNGLSFIFWHNGSGQIRENNSTKTTLPWMSGGNDGAYHDFLFEIRGVDDTNPFDGSSKAEVKLYVDGNYALTYTTTSGFSTANNYIGVEGGEGVQDAANTVVYFDNLSITKIPEPTTLALLASGLTGLLAYAWRKRK